MVKEAAWVGCSPMQLKTFYLVRQRMQRAYHIPEQTRLTADVVSRITEKVAYKLSKNKLVKRIGTLVQCDGKFEASAPFTGVKWQ